MRQKKTPKQNNNASRYFKKWLFILAIMIAIGGVFAFGLVAFIANLFGETVETYNPIWMVYMIPLMFLIATPITIFISRATSKHVRILTDAMSAVANGQTNVTIATAGNEAFASIYHNFNKMSAEIAGIEALRIQLVDSFSHELKTPIASINGFAKMLLTDDLNEEKRKKYLSIIIKESDRLAALAKNNLLLSKLDAQEIVTDKHTYSLSKQIQEVAINMEQAWSSKGITISADLPDCNYNGNAELISCIWQNLLSNAIKFTPKNGEIGIKLSEDDNNIAVSVSDTGMGMSDEVLQRVFERYYQAETSHTGEGHGLGLSIVNRIVKLSGGSIKASSKEGEGSTFTVILNKNNDD